MRRARRFACPAGRRTGPALDEHDVRRRVRDRRALAQKLIDLGAVQTTRRLWGPLVARAAQLLAQLRTVTRDEVLMLLAQSLVEYGGGGFFEPIATTVASAARLIQLNLREDRPVWIAAAACVAFGMWLFRRRERGTTRSTE